VRPLVLVLLLLLGCETPCALVCASDSECVRQGALPGYYCLNNTVCMQDCYKCGGSCVDTFANCGECGKSCATGEVCSQGSCVATPGCAPGFSDCNGSCYDLAKDRVHCGACDHTCPRDQACVNNSCSTTICG
jgi:hypothetical protein